MLPQDEELLIDMVAVCRRLHQKNLLAAADGNISVRLSDGRIAMTPSGVNKSMLQPTDMALLSLQGEILQGRPSSERLMHLILYQKVPSAKAVVHAHPPTAIAWTLARPDLRELPADGLPEVILAAGAIPVVPYARPGTEAMGTNLLPFLPQRRLLILARHGALCWGDELAEAANGIERVEQVSLILKLADELGGSTPLPAQELRALRQLREQIGPRII